jgi:hypothetical protein
MKANQLFPILKKAIENRFNILVQGSPGISKTSLTEQAAKELDSDLITILASTMDPVDIRGLPAIVNGKAMFLPYNEMERMLETKKKLVVLLDDIGNSTPAVQAVFLNLILAREINGKKISNNVSFVACTNRRQDSTGVSGLIKALVSRFHVIIELEADPESWKKWALNNGVPIELVSFINFRPHLLSNFDPKDKSINNFACPRTITNLGLLIKADIIDLECWKGCVGEAFSIEFMAFYKVYRVLSTLPDKIILNPDKAPIPENQAELFALIGALTHKVSETNVDSIIKYMERLPQEFQVFFLKDSMAKNEKIMETNAVISYLVKFPNLIS